MHRPFRRAERRRLHNKVIAGQLAFLFLLLSFFLTVAPVTADSLPVIAGSLPVAADSTQGMAAGKMQSLTTKADAPPDWANSAEEANHDGRWPGLDEIKATAFAVLDADSGQLLISRQPDLQVFPASTTKIMTALLAFEEASFDPDRILTVSAAAVNLPYGSSKISLMEGETIRLQDALAGLLLASGNDAANVIAENLAGSQKEFVDRMNRRALELGAVNTTFRNPSGLQDPEHLVTARDLALIAAQAMKQPLFRQLVETTSYSLPASNKHPYNGWNIITNTNRLLLYDDSYLQSDYISRITGIKTGTTNDAGSCLVTGARTYDGRELICVLLGVSLNDQIGNVWIYTRTLLEAAAQAAGSPPAGDVAPTALPDSSEQSGTAAETSEQDGQSGRSTPGPEETGHDQAGTTPTQTGWPPPADISDSIPSITVETENGQSAARFTTWADWPITRATFWLDLLANPWFWLMVLLILGNLACLIIIRHMKKKLRRQPPVDIRHVP